MKAVYNGKLTFPVYAVVLLLVVSQLQGCSGCSRSGLRGVQNEKRALLTDSAGIMPADSVHMNDTEASPGYKEYNDGDRISGKVISIIDGDTYDLLIGGQLSVRIRMEGIDAPERAMPFYNVSKDYLGELCFGKIVEVEITKKDGYNRYLAFTYLGDGTELSHEMVRSGLAWHFREFNSDEDLSGLENEARNMRKGIWQQKDPLPPWEVRALNRKGIPTRDIYNN